MFGLDNFKVPWRRIVFLCLEMLSLVFALHSELCHGELRVSRVIHDLVQTTWEEWPSWSLLQGRTSPCVCSASFYHFLIYFVRNWEWNCWNSCLLIIILWCACHPIINGNCSLGSKWLIWGASTYFSTCIQISVHFSCNTPHNYLKHRKLKIIPCLQFSLLPLESSTDVLPSVPNSGNFSFIALMTRHITWGFAAYKYTPSM